MALEFLKKGYTGPSDTSPLVSSGGLTRKAAPTAVPTEASPLSAPPVTAALQDQDPGQCPVRR